MVDETLGTFSIYRVDTVATPGHPAMRDCIPANGASFFCAPSTRRCVETIAGFTEAQADNVVAQWRAMRWNSTTDYYKVRLV